MPELIHLSTAGTGVPALPSIEYLEQQITSTFSGLHQTTLTNMPRTWPLASPRSDRISCIFNFYHVTNTCCLCKPWKVEENQNHFVSKKEIPNLERPEALRIMKSKQIEKVLVSYQLLLVLFVPRECLLEI